MITGTLRIFLLVAILVYFMLLVLLMRKGRMSIKYSLVWVFAGLVMLILIVWPEILYKFSMLVGISMPVNALYSFIFFCMLIILVSLTAIASGMNEKIKKLTQTQAIIEQRLRELEKKIEQ